ncbi:hypothetical protein HZA55_07010 [Candidatus Poribacteria bacterium]|nr:hypothetical protein [Candidatus Poribacteria bacterium]
MKGFTCKMCGFISINGSAPEKCPVCGAPKTAFEEKEDAIKTPVDPNNLTEPEKKHTPAILVAKQCGLISGGCEEDIIIKIGEIPHPMEDKHHIVHIDFYLDNEYISRFILTPKLNPAVVIHLKALAGKLSVVALCNIHKAWIKEINL